jgi:hypothetical protein
LIFNLLKKGKNMLRRKNKHSEIDESSCKKLKECKDVANQEEISENLSITFEPLFYEKIWKIEKELFEELMLIDFKKDRNISAVYNPLEYAAELHIDFLKKYLKKAPTVVFLGRIKLFFVINCINFVFNSRKA